MYDAQRLHGVMSGSGYPHRLLTQQRQRIIRALHDGHALQAIAFHFHLSMPTLIDDLDTLVAASLVHKQGNSYTPAFFIADEAEVERVKAHAAVVGAALAEHLNHNWGSLEATYKQMMVSKEEPFENRSFLLVGAQTLDVDLLDALENDGTLMPSAPHRPDLLYPEAAYYFWMVEGSVDDLGSYGKNNWNLSYPNWNFFTFGRHFVAELKHQLRFDVENQINDSARRFASAKELAEAFQIPLFERIDTALWSTASIEQANRLVAIYKREEKSIRHLYAGLRASKYTPYGFGEFFCWYDHLAFTYAIDFLAAKGCMIIPDQHFDVALWEDTPENLQLNRA